MARIFISYRREDSGAAAGRLHDRLQEHYGRDNVFMDVGSIDPGLDFIEAIERTVSSCDVLIALIGRQWLTVTDAEGRPRLNDPRDFVYHEIATVLKRNIRVIPALIQGTRMPRADHLPEALRPLTRRNALDLSDAHFHRDVDSLIETLDRALGMTSSSSSNVDSTRAARKRGWMLLIGAILASIIVAAPLIVAVMRCGWLSYTSTNSVPCIAPNEPKRNTLIDTFKLPSNNIAEFGDRHPYNNHGMEFQIFTDKKDGGKSSIDYDILPHKNSHDYYMSIHFAFAIEPPGMAYCGVYTEFTGPPAAVIDVSRYDGIEFNARHRPKNPADSGEVQFFLQVASYGIHEYRYYEAQIPLKPDVDDFESIQIYFSELQQPRRWPERTPEPFEPTQVFRIALIIRSPRSAAGDLEVDNIRLFETVGRL
jgi:hypothetical protein